MRALLLSIICVTSCGGGPTVTGASSRAPSCGPAATHTGDLVVTVEHELVALSKCRVIVGSLAIRGADIRSLTALAKLRKVTGDVNIGPVFGLDVVSGLDALREVGGSFVVAGNPSVTGLFLPQLQKVGGDVSVRNNPVALTVSLHRLRRVSASVEVRGNERLLRLDLSVLRQVDGDLRVFGNDRLEAFAAAQLVNVGGTLRVDQARLPAGTADAVRKRVQGRDR